MAVETKPCPHCGVWNKVDAEQLSYAVCGQCKGKLGVNYYELFELSPNATIEEIKKSYRQLAFKWHPDKNSSSSAGEIFKLVGEAYSVLSDPQRRQAYDNYLSSLNQKSQYHQQTYSAPDVDPNQAAQIFMEEVFRCASELAYANKSWNKIAPELIERGCPPTVAQYVAQACVAYRKRVVRKMALKPFLVGLFWFAIGMLVTFSGQSAVIMWGAIVFGGYQMFKALYYLITGNVPAPQKTYEAPKINYKNGSVKP